MTKICPKCSAEFNCMHDDIVNCECSSIKLSEQIYKYISENFDDCLCFDCLRELAEEYK